MCLPSQCIAVKLHRPSGLLIGIFYLRTNIALEVREQAASTICFHKSTFKSNYNSYWSSYMNINPLISLYCSVYYSSVLTANIY